MIREQFEQYIEEGIAALPEWVRAKLENVAFLLSDAPTRTQREDNDLAENDTLFGLYEGVPLSERGNSEILMPDRITIFMEPICEAYTREEDIRECVRNTIWHEVAHHFGHGEEWVEKEEARRGLDR
jgi:predicted Zn-dependent protease with MMP-like domain